MRPVWHRSEILCTLAVLLLLSAGCATPIGVNYVDPSAAYHSLSANAISAGRPSSFAARELMNRNLYQVFDEDPEKALAELHAGLAPQGDEDSIFALAELSFLHGQNSGKRAYYLASAVYAYSFILPGKRGTPPKGIDPRLRWAADLYNQSLTQAAKSEDGVGYAIPMGGTFKLPFGEILVEFDERDLIWSGFRLKDFIPAADVEIRGLRNRYRTPGIGAALAASIEPIEGKADKQSMRIPPRLKLPVTAFLRLEDPRSALASGKLKGKLEFYTQDAARTLKVEGLEVPIEYETTSALALTLEGAPIWDFEIAGFRSGDFTIGTANLREGLFMMQPHKTGRTPVVLVHGTASSPARWAELVNELHNDPRFWEHYEIWLFMYNTGNPVAYSAMLLREALARAVTDVDPNGTDRGIQQMVVIGHSQGGLLTKMTAIDSGTSLWPFKVPPEELDLDAEDRELLTKSLLLKPLPFVRRLIFIATPHRGSYQALGLLGNFASWLVNMPGRFTKLSLQVLTLQRKGLLLGPMTGVPTSIDNMNPNNRFIRALSEIPIADGVAAHSIVGVEGSGLPAAGGDGVVKYSSAHIEGVASEKIVRSAHSMQGNPETIQEVKRILMEHAKTFAASSRTGVAGSSSKFR
jgi:pimeloyl-ACP methyl ester carboxylesterase